MTWFDRHFRTFSVLLVVGATALLVKQGIAVVEHGVTGWLRGEGAYQTEWEVRAVTGLLLVGLPFAVIAVVVRTGERPLRWIKEWRWNRAVERELRERR